MAISDAYCSAATYRAIVGKTDDAEDAEILVDLKAVSRYIEGKLGRYFTVDAAAVTRLIPVTSDLLTENGRGLFVGELSANPTSIKIADSAGLFSGAAFAATDYELFPLNALLGPEVQPYTDIVLTSTSDFSWIVGRRVQIVGKWGWAAVPPGIERATAHMTALLRLETPRATRRIAEMGDTIEASRDAQMIVERLISQYKSFYFA